MTPLRWGTGTHFDTGKSTLTIRTILMINPGGGGTLASGLGNARTLFRAFCRIAAGPERSTNVMEVIIALKRGVRKVEQWLSRHASEKHDGEDHRLSKEFHVVG